MISTDFKKVSNQRRSNERGMTAGSIGQLALAYVSHRARLGQLTGMSIPNTRNRLWALAEFAGPDRPIRALTGRRIELWLLSLHVSHATMRVYLSSVRAFTTWLVKQGHLRTDPARQIDTIKNPVLLPPRALTVKEVGKIYLACPDTRAEMIVTLMVQQGLRACEVAAAELGDVDRAAGVFTVRGKGGNQRALPITDDTDAMLRRYLGEHKLTAGPLIRSGTNPQKGIKAGTVSGIVGDIMHDAGLEESGHALRHTCASDMLERGVHVRTVQHVLGHRSLATTQRYLRRFVGDLRDAMGGRSYRDSLQVGTGVGYRLGRYGSDEPDLAGDGPQPRVEPEPGPHVVQDILALGQPPPTELETPHLDVVPAISN